MRDWSSRRDDRIVVSRLFRLSGISAVVVPQSIEPPPSGCEKRKSGFGVVDRTRSPGSTELRAQQARCVPSELTKPLARLGDGWPLEKLEINLPVPPWIARV